jgi:hypothetical protein
VRKRDLPRAGILALVAVALLGLAATAETVYVIRGNARMVEKPDALAKTLKPLTYGQKLKRLEHGEKWDKVELDGTVGYVRSDNLSTSKPASSKGGGSRFLDAVAGVENSSQSNSAATRALGPLGTKYAEDKNLGKGKKVVEETMDKMQFDAEKLEKFQREGRIGEFAGAEGGK